MSFGQAIAHCFKNYAVWKGRASRSEYWWWYLFQAIVILPFYIWTMAASIATGALAGSITDSGVLMATMLGAILPPYLIMMLIVLALFLPSLAVLIRRLHDQDKSGGFFWMALIPFVGGIILFVFMLLPGTPGKNRFDA